MSQRRIAVLIAGMLVGAQVGIAAIDGPPSAQEEYAEPAPAQAEAIEQTPAVEQVAVVEPGAVVERQLATEPVYVVPSRPRTLADATFPPLHSDVFPPSTDDRPMLPSLIAYLDRKAASIELASAGAQEPIFSTPYEWQMHPATVAYFDRIEAERLAAAEAQREAAEAQRQAAEAQRQAAEAQAQAAEETTPAAVGMVEGSTRVDSGS